MIYIGGYLSYFPRSRWRWTVSTVLVSVWWPPLRAEPEPGPGHHQPGPEPGTNSDHRSRSWNPVTERREWVWTGDCPRPRGHRSQVSARGNGPCTFTDHTIPRSWLVAEKGEFYRVIGANTMIIFRYNLNIEFDRNDVDWFKWQVTFCWVDCYLIDIFMSDTSGQGPGTSPFCFDLVRSVKRRQTLNDNVTNFLNIVKISRRNTSKPEIYQINVYKHFLIKPTPRAGF